MSDVKLPVEIFLSAVVLDAGGVVRIPYGLVKDVYEGKYDGKNLAFQLVDDGYTIEIRVEEVE